MNKWYVTLFLVLVIYNMFYDSSMLFKTKDFGNAEKTEEIKTKTTADKIIMLLVSVSVIAGLLFVIFNKWVPGIIIIILIIIPAVLQNFVGSIMAADSLKFIVFGNDNNRDLSMSEKTQFDVFVSGLLMISQFVPMSRLISFVEAKSIPEIGSEIIISVYILLCTFLITFIVLVELITPLRHLRKGCEFVASKIGGYSKRLSLYFWKTWDNPLITARFTNRVLKVSKRHKLLVKIFLFVLLIFAFAIDFISNFILLAYAFVVCSCFGAVIEFLRILGKGLLRFLRMVTGIPGYKVMKNTFRMSGIVAVFVVVIVNRMNMFFIPDDSFIAITEFLASAIVIPIIFEWIYSTRELEHSKKKAK